MKISSIKTHSILANTESIHSLLDTYLTSLTEHSIVAITSKIVSLCEGSVVSSEGANKEDLVVKESQYYLPKEFNSYGFNFTITRNTMIASAGIDLSNGNGNYVLWPRDPQKSANEIRKHLSSKHRVKHLGVIIVDSKTIPLRWGTVGTSIAHSGFSALNDYRGIKDLFDYEMRVTKANIAEGLAATSVLAMGEGAESTPIVVIEDPPHVVFQDRNPTTQELADLALTLEEDLYAPILKSAPWRKGKKA
jgi:dihydrofolate synthase / folylpolyglutamate synthase